jgi:hypothetical protein
MTRKKMRVPKMIAAPRKKYIDDAVFAAELPAAFVMMRRTAAMTPQQPFPEDTNAAWRGENCAELL